MHVLHFAVACTTLHLTFSHRSPVSIAIAMAARTRQIGLAIHAYCMSLVLFSRNDKPVT